MTVDRHIDEIRRRTRAERDRDEARIDLAVERAGAVALAGRIAEAVRLLRVDASTLPIHPPDGWVVSCHKLCGCMQHVADMLDAEIATILEPKS